MDYVIRYRRGWWFACYAGSREAYIMRRTYQSLRDALWEFNMRVVAVERRG